MIRTTMGCERRRFLKSAMAAGASVALPLSAQESSAIERKNDRAYWIGLMQNISNPVLEAMSKERLRATMPVEAVMGSVDERRKSTHLEAFGRLLCGIAPWLEGTAESKTEATLQVRYREWARAGLVHGCNPQSPDYMNFGTAAQSVVDTAFLVLGILRAPKQLWEQLDQPTKTNVVKALQATRQILPVQSNWLLFSAMVEAGLCFMGQPWDAMRVDYALQMHQEWYLGDGTYGDGKNFHWDYYNSFVIQPMMMKLLETVPAKTAMWKNMKPIVFERASRYAAIQERLISPEGTFPAVGRSLTYRFGAFHLLSDISLRKKLPEDIAPEQVRCALTAVMRRMIERPGTFDEKGWLRIGFVGHQPSMGETYISTGSLYLCATAWLPLGLPESDIFWAGAAKPWTEMKAWGGQDIKADHALTD